MRLTCPCCGGQFSLEAALNDAAARRAVAAALSLPAGLNGRLLRYLALFRPAERGLPWDRAARLLEELHAMIEAGAIERRGRRWPAPLAAWRQALDEIQERPLTRPLKSHGYLLEILTGLADKAEAAAEAETEAARRRPRAGTQDGPQAAAALLDAVPFAPAPCPPEPATAPPPPARSAPPPRVPPPADFRHLLSALTGKRPVESTSTSPDVAHEDQLPPAGCP